MKLRKGNLKTKLCQLALIPVICLGLATLVIASVSVYISTANEQRWFKESCLYVFIKCVILMVKEIIG